MSNLKGFNQANGYPRLLTIFAKKILEGNHSYDEIESIDMLKDKTIELKYKRVMKHVGRERASEILFRAGLGTQQEGSEKRASLKFIRQDSSKIGKTSKKKHKKLQLENHKVLSSSKTFEFVSGFGYPLKTLLELPAENETTPTNIERKLHTGKDLLEAEKARNASSVEDYSQDSSKSDSEDPIANEDTKAFSMILIGDLKENKEEDKDMWNDIKRKTLAKKNKDDKAKVEKLPKKKPKKAKEEARKFLKKGSVRLEKTKKSPKRKSWKLKDYEKQAGVNSNLEEKLCSIDSEANDSSS